MMWHRPEGFVLGGSGRAHLKVEGLAAGYGPVQVLRGLRLEALPGLTVVLGPNGAGKTTLLRALAGLIPRLGEVLLDGEELPEKTHEIVRAGVALVAEGRQLFPQMTVTENLELGGCRRGAGGRGAAAVPADDGDREPRAGRLPAWRWWPRGGSCSRR